MWRLLLATLACPALLTAASATADELRADGSSEAPPGSVVVIRGTAVTVVTPAAFGSELEVIRGAPASAQDTPRSGRPAEDPSPDPDEGGIEESHHGLGPYDSSGYDWNDYVYVYPVHPTGSHDPFRLHGRSAGHFSRRLDEHRIGHGGVGRHFQHGRQRHGHRAGHRVRGGPRFGMVARR